jgi:hypothetical protein
VSDINENRLLEREKDVAGNDSGIHRGVKLRDACLGEPRDDLRDITDTLRGNGRVPRPIAVVK